ncbi:MAG: C1 family peptidase [Gemmatimonadaceae bacterium]|nr:C1 family peptidase [Gemmatimonadaceae bacterium]
MAAPRKRSIKRYGWVPDLPDQRDFPYRVPRRTAAALPSAVDLRPLMPPVYDQGQLGSCTANAIGGAFEFDLLKQNEPDFVPSRLFIYYNERVIERTVEEDSGAQLRDGMKTLAHQGTCPEPMWPYVLSQFATKPTTDCYVAGRRHLGITYMRVDQELAQMRGCVAAGYPFIFGFTVYESFESDRVARTGTVPMPQGDERTLGGHAMCVVGYDNPRKLFIVRNSWGPNWGKKGYGTMPYAFFTNTDLSADFWTLRAVT